jgi:hypothetical protein
MQNEERKRRIFYEFKQCCKQKINNTLHDELQRRNDIECYDKVMESYQNYLTIIYYTYIRKFRKIYDFVLTKMKLERNINNKT